MSTSLTLLPRWFLSPEAAGYACSHCQNVVTSPINTSCGHMNCFECFRKLGNTCGACKQYSSFSSLAININHFVACAIAKLEVRCQNSKCNKVVVLGPSSGGLRDHYRECGYTTVKCVHCAAEFGSDVAQAHELVCDLRLVACSECGDSFALKLLDVHQDRLTYPLGCSNMMTCPNQCMEEVQEAVQVSAEEPATKKQKRSAAKGKATQAAAVPEHHPLALVLGADCVATHVQTMGVQRIKRFHARLAAGHKAACALERLRCPLCPETYVRQDEEKHQRAELTKHMLAMDQKIRQGPMMPLVQISGQVASLKIESFVTQFRSECGPVEQRRVFKFQQHELELTLSRDPKATPAPIRLTLQVNAKGATNEFPFEVRLRSTLSRWLGQEFDTYEGGHVKAADPVVFERIGQTRELVGMEIDIQQTVDSPFYSIPRDSLLMHLYGTTHAAPQAPAVASADVEMTAAAAPSEDDGYSQSESESDAEQPEA